MPSSARPLVQAGCASQRSGLSGLAGSPRRRRPFAQALQAGGFAWGSWAGSLNPFVWLSVGAYLIWGCRPAYRLLGLAIMPPAVLLLAVAGAAGGIDSVTRGDLGNAFLALHVGSVLIAFASFALGAGLGGLFLWQERRLKSRSADLLTMRAPGLAAIDRVMARMVGVGVAALTLGLGAGLVRLAGEGRELDSLSIGALATWMFFAIALIGRREFGWRSRTFAWIALAGFGSVVAVRLGLATLEHF